jgi:hypothetical protein
MHISHLVSMHGMYCGIGLYNLKLYCLKINALTAQRGIIPPQSKCYDNMKR